MQKAKDIMTPNPKCCRLNSSVLDAVKIMKEDNCGIVPIVSEEGQCVGVITDRDLCLNILRDHKDPEFTTLQEVMTLTPITCHADENMDDVLRKMEQRMVRWIPVVNENNRCIGIISETGIALKMKDRTKISELFKAVSQRIFKQKQL